MEMENEEDFKSSQDLKLKEIQSEGSEKQEIKSVKWKTYKVPINYKQPKFRLQTKNIFLTYSKCPLPKQSLAAFLQEKLSIDYLCIAQEHHEDGSQHLHALVTTKNKVDIRDCRFFDAWDFHPKAESARDTDYVRTYILKEDKEPLEIGEYCGNSKRAVMKKLQETKEKNELVLNNPLPNLVQTGHISIYSYKQFSEAKRLYYLDMLKSEQTLVCERICLWIYGKPGTGKSWAARHEYGDKIYLKQQNHWWQGYNGEPVVLIDDFDTGGACLSHHLKIWSDTYSFTAEIKGGHCYPVYHTLIITSNYLPEEIWCNRIDNDQSTLVSAIRRRFVFYEMKDRVMTRMETNDERVARELLEIEERAKKVIPYSEPDYLKGAIYDGD